VYWVHAIGLYFVIGIIVFCLGMLAKVHMGGKIERSVPFIGGMIIGVLLWPFILAAIGIAWKIKRKTRKVERLLGYCAHATPWEPYCRQCRKDIEREKDEERELRALQNELAIYAVDLEAKETAEKYIRENPKCIKCGISGNLNQYGDSVWVICGACGRRVFVPDPSAPEEIDGPPGMDSRKD